MFRYNKQEAAVCAFKASCLRAHLPVLQIEDESGCHDLLAQGSHSLLILTLGFFQLDAISLGMQAAHATSQTLPCNPATSDR